MEIEDNKFNQVKKSGEQEYKSIGSVYCPYLKASVAFNAKGLEHLKFKRRDQARSRTDQYIRFRSLKLAPKILSLSHTLQGNSESHTFVSSKTKDRREKIAKRVLYYEFVAVVGQVRVRIIVRSPEGERPYFWSIIPFWKNDEITRKRLLHNGKPTED